MSASPRRQGGIAVANSHMVAWSYFALTTLANMQSEAHRKAVFLRSVSALTAFDASMMRHALNTGFAYMHTDNDMEGILCLPDTLRNTWEV